ncbi:hypothetical protein LINPERHAP2_LOCUS29896 [Linum perenne]
MKEVQIYFHKTIGDVAVEEEYPSVKGHKKPREKSTTFTMVLRLPVVLLSR